jgi:hypothetical protein
LKRSLDEKDGQIQQLKENEIEMQRYEKNCKHYEAMLQDVQMEQGEEKKKIEQLE